MIWTRWCKDWQSWTQISRDPVYCLSCETVCPLQTTLGHTRRHGKVAQLWGESRLLHVTWRENWWVSVCADNKDILLCANLFPPEQSGLPVSAETLVYLWLSCPKLSRWHCLFCYLSIDPWFWMHFWMHLDASRVPALDVSESCPDRSFTMPQQGITKKLHSGLSPSPWFTPSLRKKD